MKLIIVPYRKKSDTVLVDSIEEGEKIVAEREEAFKSTQNKTYEEYDFVEKAVVMRDDGLLIAHYEHIFGKGAWK